MKYAKQMLDEIKFIRNTDKMIVLFGAGEVGLICAKVLENWKKAYIFCDNDERLSGNTVHGKKCENLDFIKRNIRDAIVIICAYKKKSVDEMEHLLDDGYLIYHKEALFYYYTINMIKRPVNGEKFAKAICKIAECDKVDRIINSDIGVPITSRCNLKCKHCGYLLPYIAEKKDYDKYEIVNSVRKLIEISGCLMMVTVVGGEPFLDADLLYICEELGKLDELMILRIVTNGKKIPEKGLLKKLSNVITCIMISDYGELSKYKNDILDIAHQENVCCYASELNEWFPVQKPSLQNRTEQENIARMRCCEFNKGGYFVMEGCLWKCGFSAWATTNGLIEAIEEDFVRLTENVHLGEEIKCLEEKDLKACAYCTTDFEKTVPRGEQM